MTSILISSATVGRAKTPFVILLYLHAVVYLYCSTSEYWVRSDKHYILKDNDDDEHPLYNI